MIASKAIAVLPVCRSPIINSLWPLPIGTILSTALSPICTGSSTGFLVITPGATFSTGEVNLVLIGPLPSIGFPRASTTLPTSSGPTGTSKILPVHLATPPSASCL